MNYYEGTWAGPKMPPNGYTVAEFEEALDRMLELINQYNLDISKHTATQSMRALKKRKMKVLQQELDLL